MPRSITPLRATLALLAMTTIASAKESTPPTLQSEIEELSAGFAAKAPAPMIAAFKQGTEDVRRLGLVESAKNVGDTAPTGTLTSNAGEPVELSSLWADGPVVVTFYRGGWCPYCNLSLKALQRSLSEIEGAGAKVVAIAPEMAEKAAETVAKNELEFAVLTDRDNQLAKQFGIVFTLPDAIRPIYQQRIGLSKYNGNKNDELPLAATYLIDSSGKIRWAYLNADYKKRAEPTAIIEAVKSLH